MRWSSHDRVRLFSTTPAMQGKSPPGKGRGALAKARRAARMERMAASRGDDAVEVVSKKERQRMGFEDAVKFFHAWEVARPLNAFELHIVTNVSSHQANALRGRLALPKDARTRSEQLLIFAEDGSDAREAVKKMQEESQVFKNSVTVGGQELVQDMVQGRGQAVGLNFTKVLSTDTLLPQLSRTLARSLGPRGLMPSAKRGTVVRTGSEMQDAIREAQGATDWRGDRNGVVRFAVGRINFTTEEVRANVAALLHTIVDKVNSGLSQGSGQTGIARPAGRTGEMTAANLKRAAAIIKQVHLSSTQGPAVILSLLEIL